MWAKEQLGERQVTSCLIRDARDYALVSGLVLRYPNLANDNHVAHMPFTLFPATLDKDLYGCMLEAQPIVNELTYKVARDIDFIETSLSNVIKTDDFTRRLLDIYKEIERQGQAQPLMSCLLRTDYMVRQSGINQTAQKALQQVETNVIAAGMPALSPIIRSLHEAMMNKYRIKLPPGSKLVECKAMDLVARGMIEAYDAYGVAHSYVLVVREERSNNFSDHFLIESQVRKIRPDIRFIRVPFVDLHKLSKLGPNRELLLNGNQEIALVYFRYCYDPSNYDFPESWPTRLLLEQSRAIKCPSIQFHLAGIKKFQQVLSPSREASSAGCGLERFLSARDAAFVGKLMCQFWPLDPDSPDGERGFQLGLRADQSRRWVLKPQREGGGHNLFAGNISAHLSKLIDEGRRDERSQFILMELIESELQQNKLLTRDDTPKLDDLELEMMINEVGIFGSVLVDKNVVHSNKAEGYFTRSKRQGIDEGGISSGHAGISSLLLLT